MKRIMKKIGKILGIALLTLIIICIIGTIINYCCRLTDKEKYLNSYGETLEVKGKNLSVDKQGNGDTTIILLPGLGSPSPVLEFKHLAGKLKEKYTVITVEPFGYGLSDQAKEERSIENIVDELHEAIQKMGVKEYYLMGHSISGIYSLYYAQYYPDEMLGFIGIDNSVPHQSDYLDIQWLEELFTYIGKFQNTIGLTRLQSAINSDSVVPEIEEYTWSDKDAEIWKYLSLDRAYNKTVMNEMKTAPENLEKVKDLKFPDTMPVLMFVSSNNCEMLPQWEQLHKDIISNTEDSRVEILEGTHYLHYIYGEEIADKVDEWLAEK